MSKKNLKMPVLALLAGGKGTRLGDMTKSIPKSMVEVAGGPFIEHQLKVLQREGILEVVICAGHLADQIQNFVRDGSRFGLSVKYSIEKGKLLGTGGAIRKALPLLGEIFWVMYGDSYLDISFQPIFEFFLSKKRAALITVLKNENKWDKSNVCFEHGKVTQYNKSSPSDDMKYIDYGLGLFRKAVFHARLEPEVFDLAGVYAELAGQGELSGYEVNKRFYEIGSSKGLEKTREYFKK